MDIRRKCSVPFADRVTFPETLYAEGISTGSSGEVGDILTVLSLNCTFAGRNNLPVQIISKNLIHKKFRKSHIPDSALSVYWPAFMLSSTYFPFLSVTATSFCDKNIFTSGKGFPFAELCTRPPTVKPVTLKS